MTGVLDVIYSPVCEKLPLVEAIARRHALALRAHNAWTLDPAAGSGLPGHVREALEALREGRDGFYAWVPFLDGERLPDLEARFPLGGGARDPSWAGEKERMTAEAREARAAVEAGARVRVVPLSPGGLLQGLEGPGAFCLGWLSPRVTGPGGAEWASIRRQRRDFLVELFLAHGACGFLACAGEKVLAFVTFFPQTVARRCGYYCSPRPADPERTLVVGCLYVPQPLRALGLARRLLQRLVDHARDAGFGRVEAVAVGDNHRRRLGWHAIHPFLDRGFVREGDARFADGYSDMAFVALDLDRSR